MGRFPRAVAAISATALAIRGLDYLTGDGTQLLLVEITPADSFVWGITALVIGVATLAAAIAGHARALAIASVFAACTYVGFAGILAVEIFAPPIDDWRFIGDYITRAVLFLLIAWYATVQASVEKHLAGKGGRA